MTTLFAIALMFLTAVILIVALTYIITVNRSKERLVLLEKGIDPKDVFKDRFFLNSVRAGIIAIGIGLGFSVAVLVDEYILIGIDNPGIYPACILVFTGTSLILFYRFFNKSDSQEN